MAANPKVLRIVDGWVTGSTRVLEIECIEGGAFDRVGGKYVIVHTGLTVNERAVKRAYSLMPGSAAGRARIAIKRFSGPGSNALHETAIGTTLGFSGPWGKLVPDEGLAERTLLFATDTGITSALGVVEERALSKPLEVVWLRAAGDDFLDVDEVRKRIEDAGVSFVTAEIGAVEAPTRVSDAWHFVDARARALEATHVIATGDGAIVHPLREALPARAPTVRDVRIECFFRNPEKKSA